MRRVPLVLIRSAVASGLLAIALAVAALGLHRGWWRLNHPDTSTYPIWGLDVSHHQGVIDWPLVSKTPRLRFVYVKATEGADWTDARFLENWKGAQHAGLKVGAYHFYSFCSDPLLQARNFLSNLPRDSNGLAPVIDLEFGGNCRKVPSRETLVRDLIRFMEAVERDLSKKPMLYVTRDAYDAFVAGSGLAPRIWIRDIWREPELRGWTLWQFANRDHVPGISGFVDLNVFNGTSEALENL